LLSLPPLPRLILFLVTLAALPACGVEFKESFEGTELIKTIALSGERVAGRQLTVTLTVSQGYPVPVRVACLYANRNRGPAESNLEFEERATLIGETLLPAAPADSKSRIARMRFNALP